MTTDEKLDLLILRVEQLILLQSRFRLTNQAVTEFTEQLLLDIERKHYDAGENSVSPNGFPREFAPKQEVVGINVYDELREMWNWICLKIRKRK